MFPKKKNQTKNPPENKHTFILKKKEGERTKNQLK